MRHYRLIGGLLIGLLVLLVQPPGAAAQRPTLLADAAPPITLPDSVPAAILPDSVPAAILPDSVPAAILPDAALAALLAEARASLPAGCPGRDLLVRILCSGQIRVGVRSNYPQFGMREGEVLKGYEVDLARLVATHLGVETELVAVTPANRLALLAEGRIDLAIATIGHNTQRDAQARFVLPHYYQSETILLGPRQLRLANWVDMAGRAVCVTVGNGSNAALSARGGRLLLFDHPAQLLDQLQSGSCSLVAQDDSFFAAALANPGFTNVFEKKFAFAPTPWGMAVPREDGAGLARALGLLLQILHRDGQLVTLARANHIDTTFLQAQQANWNRPGCNSAHAADTNGCMLAPLNIVVPRTHFAAQVEEVETWARNVLGVRLVLPMLTSAPAWTLLCAGMVNSLILVAGTIAATLVFALAFAVLRETRALRASAWLLGTVLQSCPVVLALVIAQGAAIAILPYSTIVALTASIVTLGLINGAYAGQAIAEAAAMLRTEPAGAGLGHLDLLRRAMHRSGRQIDSFLVNATKGTPAASFIGTPELLNALTDISSFSSERISTYGLLLVFYTVMVVVVVRLCALLRRAMDPERVAA